MEKIRYSEIDADLISKEEFKQREEFEDLAREVYEYYLDFAPNEMNLRKETFGAGLLLNGLGRKIREIFGIHPGMIVDFLNNGGKDTPSWHEFFSHLSLVGAALGTYPA